MSIADRLGEPRVPGATADRMLVVENVTKLYRQEGRAAVLPTSLWLKPRQSLGIVGESGSGKTTLARMICGLTRPTEGSVRFGGLDVQSRRDRRSLRGRIQMVLQDPYDSLNPRIRVGASLKEPMLLAGVSKVDAERRSIEMLDRVQLGKDFADRFPEQLSGGQLQRVSIARALASDPELVLLDEPTSALDWMTRSEILKLLNTLRRDLALTYLVISHDIDAVASVCDDIAVMYFGSIVEYGPAEQVVGQPRHPYTRALMGSVLEPRVSSHKRQFATPLPDDRVAQHKGCTYYGRCSMRLPACAVTEQTLPATAQRSRIACMVASAQPDARPG